MKLEWSHGKVLIGVIHLLPLPGSPRYGGSMQPILDRGLADAAAYEKGGASAVIIENFGDIPFTANFVPPETIAAMARAGAAVREAIQLPIGFNVLRNDARAALGPGVRLRWLVYPGQRPYRGDVDRSGHHSGQRL